METLKFDLTQKEGKLKNLNAVNNGPVHKRHTNKLSRSNLDLYKALRIPFIRTHDTPNRAHSIEVEAIFSDFEKDPYDPNSYDFAQTDEDIQVYLLSGAEVFYRLGASSEGSLVKHYRTVPPKDFEKWAIICEHIIRHYNEGWADGFKFNIRYWEIWNEPDLAGFWVGGTKEEFFDMFATAALHLKKCFPYIKIGGPAIAHDLAWSEDFLRVMQKRNVPLDFFSWHSYYIYPEHMIAKSEKVRQLLDNYGYTKAESILNEWNYVKGWTDEWNYSLEVMRSMKGAAFIMASISAAQDSTIDMLMYYDTRVGTTMNGVFDFYTLGPLKGYYTLLWFADLKDNGEWVKCENKIDNIYNLCTCNEEDKVMAVFTYYTDEDDSSEKTFDVDFGKENCEFEIYLLDKEKSNEKIRSEKVNNKLTLTMTPNSCVLIKEV